MLEATHRFTHQLWRSAQIPLRVCNMNMPQKRAQQRQASFGVLLRAVPVHQRGRGKSMAKIVQTRPMAVARAAQSDASRGRIERAVNLSAIQSVPPARDEQARGDRAFAPMPLASIDVA